MALRLLSWNLFHGRDFPPDPALFTLRSRLLGVTERNSTHVQVNRELRREFARVLAAAEWDVALLQECPPRFAAPLATACGADSHRVLTSRNAFQPLSSAIARLNPDLIASWEGGSNTTLVRRGAVGRIAEERELELRAARRPERRAMAFTRLEAGVCVANLHASTDDRLAADELRVAADRAVEWADGAPLILGGDLNLRPRQSSAFDELTRRHGFSEPSAPDAIDHLLVRGAEVVEPSQAWPAERREVDTGWLALRLSDHAPVQARFRTTGSSMR